MKNEQTDSAIRLLKRLIETPSFSTEEQETAKLISEWSKEQNIDHHRVGNNLWAKNKFFDANKPTLLLNSHHDTVRPNSAYTRNPFQAEIVDGKLYGLGSNDAGGCLVSLLTCFAHFYQEKELAYNLVMVDSAVEENSGSNSLSSVLPMLPKIDVAIVGARTFMNMAMAETGLAVLHATAR